MMQQPPPPPAQPQQWGVIPPPAPQQQYGQPAPAPAPAMWPQQQYYAAPPPAPAPQPMASGDVKTLWIGDLQYWMEENYVFNCFVQTNEVLSVKLIRDKQSGNLQGYGFIEFATRAMAEQVLQIYNGQPMPNTDQPFRLNWASAGEKRDDSPDYSIFVGDLAGEVTDYVLQETFKVHYPSVKGAKVVTDKMTGRSKGYGFVKFGDPTEQARAMTEMNGMVCSTRPMRIGPATNKKALGLPTNVTTTPTIQGSMSQNENDPNNTTIFVGGLDPNVSEEELKQYFSPYGELIHVKIPVGKRCGFVQFANRANAEEALMVLQGTQMGGQKVRLSWGRSPSSKQPQQDPNQWAGNSYYGYGQGYDAYGYGQPAATAAPPQDPNTYAYGGYQGYPNYQQPQQPQQ